MKRKAILTGLVMLACCFAAHSQQNIIADKDNTHPQQSQEQYAVARVYAINAVQMSGYNEVRWLASGEDDTKRYIVEYSTNGIDFQVAGETMVQRGNYLLKHTILDPRTFLYRIKIEKKDGRFGYTPPVLMQGAVTPAVLIYPTIIENNVINVKMDMPVQRLAVIATDGREVFSKQMGGLTGSTQLTMPGVGRGSYYMVFYGNGWKSTEKFVVGR